MISAEIILRTDRGGKLGKKADYMHTRCPPSLKWPCRPLLPRVTICIRRWRTDIRRAQGLFDGWWLPVGCIVLAGLFSRLKCAAYVRDEKFMKIIESKSLSLMQRLVGNAKDASHTTNTGPLLGSAANKAQVRLLENPWFFRTSGQPFNYLENGKTWWHKITAG